MPLKATGADVSKRPPPGEIDQLADPQAPGGGAGSVNYGCGNSAADAAVRNLGQVVDAGVALGTTDAAQGRQAAHPGEVVLGETATTLLGPLRERLDAAGVDDLGEAQDAPVVGVLAG